MTKTLQHCLIEKEAGFARLRFALLISQSPYTSSSRHGLQFAQAVLQRGHQLLGLFFMDAGVLNASALQRPASDEYPLLGYWQNLAINQQVPLYLCASAAERFGVDTSPALAEPFQITGLGQWIELSQQADRVLRF